MAVFDGEGPEFKNKSAIMLQSLAKVDGIKEKDTMT